MCQHLFDERSSVLSSIRLMELDGTRGKVDFLVKDELPHVDYVIFGPKCKNLCLS